jgi:alkylhydroperoxidase family enzyme
VAQLADLETAPLTARERVALEFTDKFSVDWGSIDDAFLARMAAEFSDEEIVELGKFIAWFAGTHRLHGIFDLEPPPLDEDGLWYPSARD